MWMTVRQQRAGSRSRPVWDLESYKAYISLDKPAVRDANEP